MFIVALKKDPYSPRGGRGFLLPNIYFDCNLLFSREWWSKLRGPDLHFLTLSEALLQPFKRPSIGWLPTLKASKFVAQFNCYAGMLVGVWHVL